MLAGRDMCTLYCQYAFLAKVDTSLYSIISIYIKDIDYPMKQPSLQAALMENLERMQLFRLAKVGSMYSLQ